MSDDQLRALLQGSEEDEILAVHLCAGKGESWCKENLVGDGRTGNFPIKYGRMTQDMDRYYITFNNFVLFKGLRYLEYYPTHNPLELSIVNELKL